MLAIPAATLDDVATAVLPATSEPATRAPATEVTTPADDFTMMRELASTTYSTPFVSDQTAFAEENLMEVAGTDLVLLLE